ncbi:GH25 family lysozyme, partial [Rhizobium johnstonii]|uniref:GH25 family lysozyme n=1 Tax=Rhizobium johnstonii TaxID=3019933 RepID=UPI003F975D5C
RFDEYWREARAAGIPHSPYHFYYFCSSADHQADWFIRNVPKEAMRLPPVLDVEWNAEFRSAPFQHRDGSGRSWIRRSI